MNQKKKIILLVSLSLSISACQSLQTRSGLQTRSDCPEIFVPAETSVLTLKEAGRVSLVEFETVRGQCALSATEIKFKLRYQLRLTGQGLQGFEVFVTILDEEERVLRRHKLAHQHEMKEGKASAFIDERILLKLPRRVGKKARLYIGLQEI